MSSTLLVPVGPFYGALYFSAILSVAFYGVTCMQTFFYYIHYQEDPSSMKSFVAIIWGLNTIHEALIISGVYKYIMGGLVNPLGFLTVVPELTWELLLTTLVSVPTQGFFVYRIYLFSDKNIIAPIIWLPLGIYQFVAAILYIAKSANATSITELGDAFFTDLSISYCSIAAGVDILIAICLTFLLTRRRIATGFKSSAKILQLLTVFAINSGIWTALFALLTIIFLRVYSTELTYVVFDLPLCAIYCNTLLANLNARSYIKGQSSTLNVGADLMSGSRGSGTKNNTQHSELKFFSASQATKNSEIMSSTSTDVNPMKAEVL